MSSHSILWYNYRGGTYCVSSSKFAIVASFGMATSILLLPLHLHVRSIGAGAWGGEGLDKDRIKQIAHSCQAQSTTSRTSPLPQWDIDVGVEQITRRSKDLQRVIFDSILYPFFCLSFSTPLLIYRLTLYFSHVR